MPSSSSPETPIDRAVARQSLRQHGLVTAEQLLKLGVTRSALRARLRRGQWTKAETGVIWVEGALVTWESVLLAHILAAGAGAMASHRSAAALWGWTGSGGGSAGQN